MQELADMRGQLEPDETELRELTDSALRKLVGITDEQSVSQNQYFFDFGKHARSFYEQKARAVCGGYKSNEIFFRQRPCGVHLQEMRCAACRPAVRENDPHQAVEFAVAVVHAAAGIAQGATKRQPSGGGPLRKRYMQTDFLVRRVMNAKVPCRWQSALG